MNSIADAIQQFFTGANEGLTPFLAALSVIGIATMAIIQAVKDIFPVRRRFQHRALHRWLHEGAGEANAAFAASLPSFGIERVDADAARDQLIRLSVDGIETALLDLSIEQMCGQMNSAVQVALDHPKRYAHLLLVAASIADRGDVELLPLAERSRMATASDSERNNDVANARNRVASQLQRAIDGFQISTSFLWKRWLQGASFGLSLLLSVLALASWTGAQGLEKIFAILLTAFAAGFLAPVARDLTAALQKMRG